MLPVSTENMRHFGKQLKNIVSQVVHYIASNTGQMRHLENQVIQNLNQIFKWRIISPNITEKVSHLENQMIRNPNQVHKWRTFSAYTTVDMRH